MWKRRSNHCNRVQDSSTIILSGEALKKLNNASLKNKRQQSIQ